VHLLLPPNAFTSHPHAQILCEETLTQRACAAAGAQLLFPAHCASRGVLCGAKLDRGIRIRPQDTWTVGLDTLDERARASYAAGARFAKWRATCPVTATPRALDELAHGLVRFAESCLHAGLLPVLEPEVEDATATLHECEAATLAMLSAVFAKAELYGLPLRNILLKTNMVRGADVNSPEEVAASTLWVLHAAVPPSVPGVLFLSGSQSEAEACANLEAIVRLGRTQGAPWRLTFAWGRALTSAAIKTWGGREESVEEAQAMLLERCAKASAAARA
jgi:fructose-bisphosphate aldolase, class I